MLKPGKMNIKKNAPAKKVPAVVKKSPKGKPKKWMLSDTGGAKY